MKSRPTKGQSKYTGFKKNILNGNKRRNAMNKHRFSVLISLLLAVAVLTLGLVPAHAGPGGGTYYANSPAGGASGTALRKFVDTLPGIGAANANNLGQYIPVATADTTTYPGSDYYQIELVEYTEKMHSDLPKATKLRGYRDLAGNQPAHYLGPLIIAQRDRPVRLLFKNSLPTGTAGDLFIPVDTTIMGAGPGPLDSNGLPCMVPGTALLSQKTIDENCLTNLPYKQNRATLHLHGGNSPWISDGTPHQWTVPALENTPYKKGVGARDVPDMPATGDGELTFYWTNQQSGRLMFYHDHSYGITRLNVYAGEAAGYLLTDPVEENLINSGVLPNLGGVYRYGIPLVIQDKTFVPQNIAVQDSKWDLTKWGQPGDLWFPHIMEPNQDPFNPEGANPFGRWDYGPWFWPPQWVPADKSTLPEPSVTPEGFHDTPIINGTAYPYLTVAPKPYRFRILNASNDRFLNLNLFYVDPADPSGKEVKMVPATPGPTIPAGWPIDGRDGGGPDPAFKGPDIIQIGNESGFIPAPVVFTTQPINYNYNRRDIVVLNVQEKNLFMGPAERADVIIDFSSVPPGSTLILYNDSPSPVPAGDPRYDYYTGNPDQTLGGGAPSTLRGYGPNTRTIMQFRVAGTPSAPFNVAALEAALPAAFKASQPAPVVPEPTYPVASGGNGASELYAAIQDYSMTFVPIGSTIPTTMPFQTKAIQELWDLYGRMNATLGVELPFTNQFNQTTIPMNYAEPATERIIDGQAQIWKITHNGVDTHPVHFHMFDVQIINRVGWDGAIRPPDPNELGWKETVRMNPLEDCIIALRPKNHTLPFALSKSIRPIDPTLPDSGRIGTTDITTDPRNGMAAVVPNVPADNPLGYDYGYEYVWHCHILGHEENDFMRPVIFEVSTVAPPAPTLLSAYAGGGTVPGKPTYIASYVNSNINQIVLQWADGAPTATPSDFRIERAVGGGGFQTLTTISFLMGYPPIYADTSINPGTTYSYRVFAVNKIGDSLASNTVTVNTGAWPSATSVTLTPSKPTPHVEGTNVRFTAAGTGAVLNPNPNNLSVAYQYRFKVNGVIVQDFSNKTFWTMSDTTPVGSYTVSVDARTSPNQNPLVSASIVYQVIVPPTAPVTVSSPVPGFYAAAPVNVTLSSTTVAPPATIYYTTDGTIPTTASTVYTAPIALTSSTTVNYFAVDVNGTAETVKSDTWAIGAQVLTASVTINNGAVATNNTAVTLALNAVNPAGIATMQFSNDGITYSAEELFAATKAWTLAAGDGVKNVYVRFRDKSLPTGVLYAPVSAVITLDTVLPVTTASPITGTYSTAPVLVTLTSNEPAIIYYTVDGTTPTTASSMYVAPISLVATTTVKYMAVDIAGNSEAAKTGTWTIHELDMVASVVINNGAARTNNAVVNLTVSAVDPMGVATMQFSNDGVNFSAEETYATTKVWTLTAGDGVKTVYARFRDMTLPAGTLYSPISSNIVLDTTLPVTTPSPIPGSYASTTVPVSLTANESATIYYTTDGTAPTTASAVYTGPILLSADTTVKYFAVDAIGNVEAAKTSTWLIHTGDMVASVSVNNAATFTNNANVTLTLSAVDALGVATMQFSNDGTNYSAEETYATSKAWVLAPGDGIKTVYVRFRDNALGGGNLYNAVSSSIILDTLAPVTTSSPIAGTYSTALVPVALSVNEPSTIYYTTDGTTPTKTSTVYTGPIQVGTTTTVKYFAVDAANNAETPKTETWTIHEVDLVASILINNGAARTNNASVSLTLSAVDPMGVATMQFSNDGVNFTAEEAYATSKSWTLSPGDGIKTVYVRFRDNALPTGSLYDPISANIVLATAAPTTTVTPVPATYSSGPVVVGMSSNMPATIYYTVDGSEPTTASAVYTAPISIAATTTLRYFAVDLDGNAEAVKSGTWTIHADDMVSSITINTGAAETNSAAVALTLSATDPVGVSTMQFSNDGVNYTAEESYATSKAWTLPSGDGLKTVYVRFRDNALPIGVLYPPVSATVTLDTIAPVTTVSPVPGTYSAGPVAVTLTANERANIHYTTDGSVPTTSSAVYSSPISVASENTIRYFAVDLAGNAETAKSGTWTVHVPDMVASVKINNEAVSTKNTAVTLTLSAIDDQGVSTMQFSNDGISYTAEEAYATSKAWTITSGDGVKTVYVRFRDNTLPSGNQYDPVTASIKLDTTAPVTTASPVPGVYSVAPSVVLAANETATIYYTTDGSAPTTSSAVYSAPIALASNTTVKYFGVDSAGNVEAVKSGTWTIHESDMVASVTINNGATETDTLAVSLALSATDPLGVATMQFSNDGANYSEEEAYATSKSWTLATGDGQKTVYVRFRDKALPSGTLYAPVFASILLNTMGAPADVSAVAGNAWATVSFSPPQPAGDSEVKSYTVTSSPGGIIGTGTTSPITVTGLTNGTAYTFTVVATNAVGTGPVSDASNTVVPTATVPGVPTKLTAKTSLVSTSAPTVTLSWTDNGIDETGFKIQRATNDKFTTGLTLFTVGVNVKSYTDTTVKSKKTYYYRVQAVNSAGNSKYSKAVKVVAAGQLPLAPTDLVEVSTTKNSIEVLWHDNSGLEKNFIVQWATDAAFTKGLKTLKVGPNVITAKIKGMKPNTDCWVRVRAVNAIGSSEFSNVLYTSTLP